MELQGAVTYPKKLCYYVNDSLRELIKLITVLGICYVYIIPNLIVIRGHSYWVKCTSEALEKHVKFKKHIHFLS